MACSDAVAVPGKPKPDWHERKETYLHHLETDADADALLRVSLRQAPQRELDTR